VMGRKRVTRVTPSKVPLSTKVTKEHEEKTFVYLRVLGGYFHPSWRAHAPRHNSFENTFVHEGHEGTRRKTFVTLRVFRGSFHPSWWAHAPMSNSFENVGQI